MSFPNFWAYYCNYNISVHVLTIFVYVLLQLVGSVAIDTDEFPEDHLTMYNGAYLGIQNIELLNHSIDWCVFVD